MAKVKNFKTIFPAVSVPLNEDYSINEPEFRAYLRWIKSFYGKGMDGLVCNGHTGEITGLTRAERKRVVEICAEECGDVMTIISGVNCENTAESIEMAKEAKEALSYAEDVYCTRKIIRKRHIQRMKDGDCSPDIGVYFLDIISSMERIAGYAFTIARYILSQNDEEE